MSYQFGARSIRERDTCVPELIQLADECIKFWNCSVLEGHRGEQKQNQYYAEKKSFLRYPHSKHNSMPSRAIHLAPWPIDWNDIERWQRFGFFVLGVAQSLGISNLQWGGLWRSLKDYAHFELKE